MSDQNIPPLLPPHQSSSSTTTLLPCFNRCGNTYRKSSINPQRRSTIRTAYFDPVYGAEDDLDKVAPRHRCKYCPQVIGKHIQQIVNHIISCKKAPNDAKGILIYGVISSYI